jgi:hypothetical protein
MRHWHRSPSSPVFPREGGESSTPQPLGSIMTASGILDRPVKPDDDSVCVVADTPSRSRGAFRPSFAWSLRPLVQEGAGKTGCRLAPAVRCAKDVAQKNRTAAYRCNRTLGLPCAVVGRLMPRSPGSRTFLLASLAPRIDDAVHPVGLAHISAKGLTVATTARTTRFCRTQLIRLRQEASPDFSAARPHVATGSQGLPALPLASRARRCRVHRNPARIS